MSSASFVVTYTSVYTDSEPGRVFWEADEEISDEVGPKEDLEEYGDDETEDGLVDYLMDGGDDRDDDDGDSSRDDADDEDEDKNDEEEEEEHPAPADSTVVVPTAEPVSPPEGTEPVIPPPSTDISTTRARITVRRQASISLPLEAETLRVMRDIRREMSDMQAELLAHREQQRRARQPGPDARILDHQDAFGMLTVTSSSLCYFS
ncbi:hypothetical protein Tco_1319671 [Tanacetum coccineum]